MSVSVSGEKKVCVITDNEFLYKGIKKILSEKKYDEEFEFFYSERNIAFKRKYKDCDDFRPIDLKTAPKRFYEQYKLFLSAHCKQIFPDFLVHNYRCINIHPGFNPYNRGWYPQVFSIINKLPVGVTVHEMDCELDHGPIIYQSLIQISEEDTSFDVYQKIQNEEIRILNEKLEFLLRGEYNVHLPCAEGNVNLKKDFEQLCRLDFEREGKFGEFFDELRALSFQGYKNAFFINEKGEKFYVELMISKADKVP